MKMDKRREKSANYTRNEKHLLLDKALPYLDIIENKKTDTLTVEVKVKSWTHVATQYNAANPKGQRRVTQLKNLYENIKKRTKKDILTYQAELRETGGKTSLRKIDDVGWRLIKSVPSLRALWKNTLLTKRNITNNSKDETPTSSIDTIEQPSELSAQEEDNIDYSVIVKQEYVPDDAQEYFVEDEIIAEITDAQKEAIVDVNNYNNEIEKHINESINDDGEVNFLQSRRDNDGVTLDSMYEMDKEIKKKEIEKLDLDIQMKKMELEFMKGRLKEQELSLKFKQLDYEIKCRELTKAVDI